MADGKSSEREVCLEEILRSLGRVEHKLDQLQINTGGEICHKPNTAMEKVTCKVRCTVISLGLIDTIKQEFWAEVYLTVQWKEDKLKGVACKNVDWNDYWDPQLYFVNAGKIDRREQWHTILPRGDGSTDVKLSIRMRATFKTRMKLHWFPFDCQELTIKLMSDWPVQYLEFKNDRNIKDCIRTDTFTGSHEWILHDHVIAVPLKEEKEKTGSINEFPHYHISMNVQRRYAHYLWNLVLVIFMLMVLSFSSFSIPGENADARFGVTVALLLTAVAYKFIVNAKLPMIPYLTLMDRYVLWSLVIHALMVIQNALCLVLSGLVSKMYLIDYVSIAVLGGIALTVNVSFAIIGVIKTREADAKMKENCLEYEKIYADTLNGATTITNGNHAVPVINTNIDVMHLERMA